MPKTKVKLVTDTNKLKIYHMTRDQIDAAHMNALTRIDELNAELAALRTENANLRKELEDARDE